MRNLFFVDIDYRDFSQMLITVALVISHSYPYLKANNITRQNPSVGLGSLKNLTTLSIDAEKCARLTRNALK